MNRSLLHSLLVAPAVAGLLALASTSSVSAAGPIENDPLVDPARAGLAQYLAQLPIDADGDDQELADGCPIIEESDFTAPLSFFGPVGTFDTFSGVAVSDGLEGGPGFVGVGCDAERSVAAQGGVLDAGIGMFDLAAIPEQLDAVMSMPPITSDGASVLGGRTYGECFDGGGAFRCAAAWVLDGFAVMVYVEFESVDSQKDPATAVARLLATHVPGLLDRAEALPGPGGIESVASVPSIAGK